MRFPVIHWITIMTVSGGFCHAIDPFSITYETGTTNSGYPALSVTNATAPDAAYLVTGADARSGNYAIAHKVTFNDFGYYSNNAWRSESASNREWTNHGTYYNGQHVRYGFSFSLRDWESYTATDHEDLIWQFKHVGGRHDISLGVQSDQLRLRWDGNGPSEYPINLMGYVNEWIDMQFDVRWTLDNTGYFTFRMRLPGETDFGHEITKSGYATFLDLNETSGDFGYLKWGLYRNDGSTTAGVPATRLIYHDDIYAYALPSVPEPGKLAMLGVPVFGLLRRRMRQEPDR